MTVQIILKLYNFILAVNSNYILLLFVLTKVIKCISNKLLFIQAISKYSEYFICLQCNNKEKSR